MVAGMEINENLDPITKVEWNQKERCLHVHYDDCTWY